MSRPATSVIRQAVRAGRHIELQRPFSQCPESSISLAHSASRAPRSLRSPNIRPTVLRPKLNQLYSISPFPTAQRRRSNLLRPLNVLVICVPIVTFFLGVWQIRRLRWKVALIDEIERNIAKEPMVLPANINVSALPEFAFRRVLLQGQFDLPPILLGPIVKDGVPGYQLIQPFQRLPIGSSTILVNRGFITSTRATAIRQGREAPPPAEADVVVEGMLSKKFDKGKGRWQPDNEPEKNQWFWKDVESMAEWCGEEKGVQAVMVDAIDYNKVPSTFLMQQGTPVGKPPTVEIRNQHATYAATWFTLSAATAGMLVFLLRKGGNTRKVPRNIMGRI